MKFTPEETKLLENHKAKNLKKMNKDAKAKYTAKKEAQAEAEKIKAELAVAAAAAEEKRTKCWKTTENSTSRRLEKRGCYKRA